MLKRITKFVLERGKTVPTSASEPRPGELASQPVWAKVKWYNPDADVVSSSSDQCRAERCGTARSRAAYRSPGPFLCHRENNRGNGDRQLQGEWLFRFRRRRRPCRRGHRCLAWRQRSEEHTSELQ